MMRTLATELKINMSEKRLEVTGVESKCVCSV